MHIEAMYHQVVIPKEDRDALRFLWCDDNGHIIHYRMTRHLFGGMWCSCSSTYALRRVLLDYGDVDSLILETVMRAFYVDDCLRSVPTRKDAIAVIEGTKSLLRKGGFKLTKFIANDPAILSMVPDSDKAKEIKDLSSKCNSKALGTRWSVEDDVFFFEVDMPQDPAITRSKILSLVSSVFDPLGLVSPIIIGGKLILQDATRLKLPWDEKVPQELQNVWNAWTIDVSNSRFQDA